MEQTKKKLLSYTSHQEFINTWYQGVFVIILNMMIPCIIGEINYFLLGMNIACVIYVLRSMYRLSAMYTKMLSLTSGDLAQIRDVDILAGMYGTHDQDGNPYDTILIEERMILRSSTFDYKRHIE